MNTLINAFKTVPCNQSSQIQRIANAYISAIKAHQECTTPDEKYKHYLAHVKALVIMTDYYHNDINKGILTVDTITRKSCDRYMVNQDDKTTTRTLLNFFRSLKLIQVKRMGDPIDLRFEYILNKPIILEWLNNVKSEYQPAPPKTAHINSRSSKEIAKWLDK